MPRITASRVPSPPMAITVLYPLLTARRAIGVAFSFGLARATSALMLRFSKYPRTSSRFLAASPGFPAPGLAINLTRVNLFLFDISDPFLKDSLEQRIRQPAEN